MKTVHLMAVGTVPVFAPGAALAQAGSMMGGGMGSFGWMGGYGGVWVPILLVIAVAGLVVWVVKQKGK